MRRPFLLCDPGLLRPLEDGADIEAHHYFWHRLVGWSTDRRLRLGEQSRAAILDGLVELGWPDFEPPQCPPGLARDARKAVTVLLSTVVRRPPRAVSDIPSLDPEYVLDGNLGTAVALDIAEQGDEFLVGAASDPDHWQRHALTVSVTPPPPEKVFLVATPHKKTVAELDLEASVQLKDIRIIVVGARRSETTCKRLETHLKIDGERVHWVNAELGHQPNLDALDAVRPETSMVVCVTGAIGHAASEKVLRLARRGGVEPIMVEKTGEILGAIRQRVAPA